ncbi:MAG: hypothetical protein V3V67_01665 [Myxococcota bacterium]
MPAARSLALFALVVAFSTPAAGASFGFQGRVDVVAADSTTDSVAQMGDESCRARDESAAVQERSTAPQITRNLEAPPGDEQAALLRCVVSVVYD